MPLLADIDDPDLEALRADGRPILQLAKRVLRPRVMARAASMRDLALSSARIVSNPELQRRYGGTVIPHVRPIAAASATRGSRAGVEVVFVGSIQPHKGIGVLRGALGRLADEGFRLTITADPPEDAHPWEDWIGRTSMEEGIRLAANADIVVIPSLNTTWARGQLPVKLVDAMLSGTASIVSDVPPLPWAIGPDGIVVPAGRVDALADALRSLGDEKVRVSYGRLLRDYGERLYTIDANTAAFAAACELARPAAAR
ncbi:glycosyltransferase [uncultured Amnibacterium sp.]|uniref:glycosyltransferase n=1 Tax=uncultured Amnibacterium sp. TaxID=1631851 RepID=UPI0035CA52AF